MGLRAPGPGWVPPRLERTSLYLHVPFCRNACPYCPYTTVPYRASLLEPYRRAALLEVDWWAAAVGPAEVTSVYVGGGTPTLALDDVARILERDAGAFPADRRRVPRDESRGRGRAGGPGTAQAGVALVSLGVQSFQAAHLAAIGRRYAPADAERALALLAGGGFASVNVDLLFALPRQETKDVLADLERAAALGADQVTTYPLFTFPYTRVGEYLRLSGVRMPDLRTRHRHYRAIGRWCAANGFERVSVWGFKRGGVPRYSSVTRDGYVGIGPGAGSHLPDGFVLNTFDLEAWERALTAGASPSRCACRSGGDERLVVALLAAVRHARPGAGAGGRDGRRRRQGEAMADGGAVRRPRPARARLARVDGRGRLLAPSRPEPLRPVLREHAVDGGEEGAVARRGPHLARGDAARSWRSR